MAWIPYSLRRNQQFLEDFRIFSELPVGAVAQLLRIRAIEDRKLASAELDALAENYGVTRDRLESARGVVGLLAASVIKESIDTLADELAQVSERANTQTDPELIEVLAASLGKDSPTSSIEFAVKALSFLGSFREALFRPTVMVSEQDGELRGVSGLIFEVHYHDADHAHEEFSFGMTSAQATQMATDLAKALAQLERIRATGSVQIIPDSTRPTIEQQ